VKSSASFAISHTFRNLLPLYTSGALVTFNEIWQPKSGSQEFIEVTEGLSIIRFPRAVAAGAMKRL
jgi:hypothetical protein